MSSDAPVKTQLRLKQRARVQGLAEQQYIDTYFHWKHLMNHENIHVLTRRKDILILLQRKINMHGLYTRQLFHKERLYSSADIYNTKTLPMGNNVMLSMDIPELIVMTEFFDNENRILQAIHNEFDAALLESFRVDGRTNISLCINLTSFIEERILLFEAV
jgi:hypothetical protein